jgi:serine phosphatase RsbU (regulator of sigma subunit)
MSATSHRSASAAPDFEVRRELLLIEDDPGDAFLFQEFLDESGLNARITVARSLQEARNRLFPSVHCVVVDLSLPDAEGLEALDQVLTMAPRAAVLVLTGLADVHVGIAAVAAGAQDYLVKQDVDGPLLARAIRYAMERKRAEETERQLVEARILGRENARLERGLLPVPLIEDETLGHYTRYQPGRRQALLGGDFQDTVQTPDGAIHLVVGDVCGHGPDEAALGVCLRMAWRALVLAGHTGQKLLETLDTVLIHERATEEIFTTLCMVTIDPSRTGARMYRAGHPRPLLLSDNDVRPLPDEACGPALGLLPGLEWPALDLSLDGRWGLMLYSDGLIEGLVDGGPERLDLEGLVELSRLAVLRGESGAVLLDGLISEAETLNGSPLEDDVTILLLSREKTRR